MHHQDKPYRVGVFATVELADRAIHELHAAGFSNDELAVVCSNDTKEQYFGDVPAPVPDRGYAPHAISVGTLAGAAIGGLAMAALALGSGGVAVPAIAGTAIMAGGAAGGAFVGAMSVRGLEGELGAYYEQMVQSGQLLVAVEPKADAPTRLKQAEDILSRAGAQPVPLTAG